MTLISKVGTRLSVIIMLLLALWTAVFYFAMVDEINDETDDALEDYSELVIKRALAGAELPSQDDGSNNSFKLETVSDEYAAANKHIEYYDAAIFIPEKDETEPARVLTTIFRGQDDTWYKLTVSTPSFERDDLLSTILGWILCLYLVILVTGLSVTMWVFYKSLRPMYTLLEWLDSYTPGHKTGHVPNDTEIKELRCLNEAVEDATNRSENAFALQKEFIGNASHELQTPLAVLGNRMERMLNNPDISEEQMGEILEMLQTQRHIVRLNKDLLLLTKIDNLQFGDSEEMDFSRLVREQQSLYEEMFEDKGIRGKIDLAQNLNVQMNRTLSEVLVSNLIRNAYIHSADGAEVSVSLSDGVLTVANSGEAPLDGELIFERFHQGTRKEGSTGLGLSIVKAICKAYNLSVEYSFKDKKHFFTVDFSKI